MRKRSAAAALALALVLASVWALSRPLRGAWLDRLSSAFLSKHIGLTIELSDTVFRLPKNLAVARARGLTADGRETLAESGGGQMWLSKEPLMTATDVRIGSAGKFVRSLGLEAGETPVISAMTLRFTPTKGRFIIRALRCDAPDMSLRGGVVLVKHRPVRAFALFTSTDALWSKIPDQWRSRLLPYAGGRLGIRAQFGAQTIQLIGRNGPLFEFNWLA